MIKRKQAVNYSIKLFLHEESIVYFNNINVRNLLNTGDKVIKGLKAVGEKVANKNPLLPYLLFLKSVLTR